MKYSFLIIALVVLASCATPRQAPITENTHTGLDPNENREEANQAGDGNVLIGPTTRVAFEQAPYSEWFHPMYLKYKPNETIMEELQPLLEGVSIKGYIGSWCLDSQREVPRFFKILDAARFPYARLELISLREDKTSLAGEEKADNVTAVPTFIFYKDGKELGRIIETAYPTLEMNMVQVLSGKSQN
ncbi:thioredoxin family protein [Rufibacter roseus]|uniref:Thioredoxin family protein n=1 Tax=Rufibacter roseus TaxID=1567108 RepID=A0ABW2DQ66_9BACT|nr:thioredoxin family protein [Rufibacter roseus]